MLTYVGQSFSSFDPQCVGVGRVQILQEISTFWWPIASSEILAKLELHPFERHGRRNL